MRLILHIFIAQYYSFRKSLISSRFLFEYLLYLGVPIYKSCSHVKLEGRREIHSVNIQALAMCEALGIRDYESNIHGLINFMV